LAGLISLHAAEPGKVLWQIGRTDHDDAEFALAPDGYEQFKSDGAFAIGASDPKKDWPYVQPGPSDSWAGHRRHTFTIVFNLKHAPRAGDCRLDINLVDAQQHGPPLLQIEINGTVFKCGLEAGAGDASLMGQAQSGKAQCASVPFAAGLLRAGQNDIEITTERGSWMIYDSVELTAPAAAQLGKTRAGTFLAGVEPLPVLQENSGVTMQTFLVTVRHFGAETEATLGFAGDSGQTVHLTRGSQTIQLMAPAPRAKIRRALELKAGGQLLASQEIDLAPAHPLTIYILPHSHHDIGYTSIQTEVEKKQMNNLLEGMAAAKRTADYPAGSRFVWNMEVLWAADLFMHRMNEEQKAEFIDAVRKGEVVLNGMFANELTGLCRPEELIQLFHTATDFAQRTGVPIESAMISDVPGYTWGTVTGMAQAGIKYFSAAPNYFDRIGTIMRDCQNRPFYWEAADGRTKVLTWIPYSGYAFSHIYHDLSFHALNDLFDEMKQVQFPYDIVYLRWSGHGDNAVPDPAICEFVRDWNAKYLSPRLIISGTTEAFRAFEQRYGAQLPVRRGDWTPYWEDGAGSSARETAMNRASSDRLTQADALWAMLDPTHFPAAQFNDAWRDVLLYSEHTWGAAGSITAPESQKTTEQWEIKKGYAEAADQKSRRVFDAFQPVEAASQFDVVNTLSWKRTQLVILPPTLSSNGDIVEFENGVPELSQRLASGELAMVAFDVPPLSARPYKVVRGKMGSSGPPIAHDNVLDNGVIRVRVDETTGGIVELRARDLDGNFVDTTGGQSLNDYLYLQGADLKNVVHNGKVRITVGDAGPVVGSLIIECDAPGCKTLRRELRLVAGQDYVELTDVVDKARLEATDYKAVKESVNFAFPFDVPDGDLLVDVPFGAMRPELDQIPGSCKNWLTVGRWADISNKRQGVTWVSLDAPLIEPGDMTATLLNSQTNPEIWRQHIGRTRRIYAWVMNNHWGTNYRAYQDGPVSFRFILRPHGKRSPAENTRFAIACSQPLLPVRRLPENMLAAPLFQLSSDDVIVNTFKPSDDGKGWILRLFGASGKTKPVKLSWAAPAPRQTWLSDTSEKPLKPVTGKVTVPGWGLVTLRVEP
jgi:hypothetical protein